MRHKILQWLYWTYRSGFRSRYYHVTSKCRDGCWILWSGHVHGL